MTDREKLIELLDMNFGYVAEMKAEELADYLISKGVTIPVRCGECTHRMEDKTCYWWGGRVDDKFFCSYGERR